MLWIFLGYLEDFLERESLDWEFSFCYVKYSKYGLYAVAFLPFKAKSRSESFSVFNRMLQPWDI